jgi:hypothetical protein
MPKIPANGPIIEVERKEIYDGLCRLAAEAGTSCPQGGDSSRGGRTVFRLDDLGCASWHVRVQGKEEGRFIAMEEPQVLEIVFAGDSEAWVLVQALEFAAETLKRQLKTNRE